MSEREKETAIAECIGILTSTLQETQNSILQLVELVQPGSTMLSAQPGPVMHSAQPGPAMHSAQPSPAHLRLFFIFYFSTATQIHCLDLTRHSEFYSLFLSLFSEMYLFI